MCSYEHLIWGAKVRSPTRLHQLSCSLVPHSSRVRGRTTCPIKLLYERCQTEQYTCTSPAPACQHEHIPKRLIACWCVHPDSVPRVCVLIPQYRALLYRFLFPRHRIASEVNNVLYASAILVHLPLSAYLIIDPPSAPRRRDAQCRAPPRRDYLRYRR
jgi:hypothetical protein